MAFKRMFNAVETHCGEPMRVVTSGIPTIPGNSVYEQSKWLEKNDDQFRKLMLREPRGYPPLCCNLIVPAKNPKAKAGYIIMEQVEYPMMSGGNTISVATALLETGMIPMQEPVTKFNLEAPAGLIGIEAECSNGKCTQVTFKNVPAFAAYIDKEIDVPHLGKVKVDVAWGGMFYVLIDVRQFEGLKLVPEMGKEIAKVSALCLKAAQEQLHVEHPDYPGVGITITELHGPTDNPEADWQSVNTVFTNDIDFERPETWTGALDRCACGTGTCALMAAKVAKGELKIGEKFVREGLIGIKFTGCPVEKTTIHGHDAIVPTIGGQSWIYGYSQYVLDETDPFPEGFTVGDIW